MPYCHPDAEHIEAEDNAGAELRFRNGVLGMIPSLPYAEQLATEVLSLPKFAQITPEVQQRVTQSLCRALAKDRQGGFPMQIRTASSLQGIGLLAVGSLVGMLAAEQSSSVITKAAGLLAALLGLLIWRPNVRQLGIVVISASVLSPNLNVVPGLPLIRIEHLVIGSLFLGFVWLGRYGGVTGKTELTWLQRLFYLWVLIMVASTLNGAFAGYKVTERDLTEVLWPAAYLLTVSVMADVVGTGALDAARIVKSLIWANAVSGLIGLLQFLDILGVNEYISPLYLGTADRQAHLDALVQSSRVFGTSGNANLYGVLMAFAMVTALAFLLQRIPWKTVWLGALFLLCGLTLFLTLSRTSLAAGIVGMLFILVRRLTSGRQRWRTIVFIGLVAVAFGSMFSVVHSLYVARGGSVYQGFVNRFYGLIEQDGRGRLDRDMMIRKTHWEDLLSDGIGPIGTGPVKEEFGRVADSEYVLVLRRYGLLGISIYTAIFGLIWLTGYRLTAFGQGSWEAGLGLALEGMVLTALTAATTNAVFYSTQNMGVLLVLFGCAVGILSRRRSWHADSV